MKETDPYAKKWIRRLFKEDPDLDPLDEADLSIKATTTDQLGFIGLEQGIAAQAICLVQW